MNDTKVKQQIAEKIKSSSNILVTVSTNPSVDELSAALGLTVMLNKLNKHATAVFSGTIPPAITFMDPQKTFESTVDSLRDFIIALDKEKADHLRYKVEGDVVKIFITPYRTIISSDDLEFSQGDYNVELVLALGVDNQEHLDGALESHGRILHDATVVTITAGDQTSDLGSIDWHDGSASSLSEMLVGLSDLIKADKPLLDQQTATALLTGIVSATDRFSNPRTTTTVMTVAAKLMSAGADQQLIAAKLQEGHDVQPTTSQEESTADTSSTSDTGESKPPKGELSINHHEGETLEQIAEEVESNNQKAAAIEAEKALSEQVAKPAPEVETPEPTVSQPEEAKEPVADDKPHGAVNWTPNNDPEPLLGGTLSATADEAADDARRDLLNDQNKTILTHSYLAGSHPETDQVNNLESSATQEPVGDVPTPPAQEPIIPSITVPSPIQEPQVVVPVPEPEKELDALITPAFTPSAPTETLADIDKQNRSQDHEDARAAVEAALGIQLPSPVTSDPIIPVPVPQPVPTPVSFDLPTPPPLPDFSQLPPAPAEIASAYALDSSDLLGDILAPEPTAAIQNTTPFMPTPIPTQPPIQSITPPPAPSNDPGQFKIPGQ